MNFELLDHIVLTDDDIATIWEWLSVRRKISLRHLPIEEGVINFQGRAANYYLYYKSEELGILMQTWYQNRLLNQWVIDYEVVEKENSTTFKINLPSYMEKRFTKNDDGHILRICQLWCGAMNYLAEYHQTSEVVETSERRVARTKKPRGGKGAKRVVYLKPKTYRFRVPPPAEKRTIERHAEAWSVRGHERKYKNGKKVWIRQHVRGIGKVTPKEYRLGGQQEPSLLNDIRVIRKEVPSPERKDEGQ